MDTFFFFFFDRLSYGYINLSSMVFGGEFTYFYF